MKTWIFDEQTLEIAIRKWIEDQKATGHPKAIQNAEFVGAAIKDMLSSNPKLFKQGRTPEATPPHAIASQTKGNNHNPVTAAEVESKDRTGASALDPSDLLRIWYENSE